MKQLLLGFVFLFLSDSGWAQQSPQRIESGAKPLMMTVAEDGHVTLDNFEIWDVSCTLRKPQPSCSILAASFITSDETRVFLWQHVARKVIEVEPRIFRVEMNGRLNPFSGLDVVIEMSSDGSSIANVSGSMRSGSKGQSVSVFQVDRKSVNRRLPPLRNFSWRGVGE